MCTKRPLQRLCPVLDALAPPCKPQSKARSLVTKTRAALAWKAGAPLAIEEVDLDGPRDNEVLVEVKATGICHTDWYTLSGADPTCASRSAPRKARG